MDKNNISSSANNGINNSIYNGALVPELVLNPVSNDRKQEDILATERVNIENSGLTEHEKAMVKDFSQKIDISDSSQILQYGNSAQKKIADFSENALANVRTKDMDEVGKMITDLVVELKDFSDETEAKGFFGLFKKAEKSISRLKVQYDSAEKNVDKICEILEGHKITLIKDITMLDRMYEMNLAYYKELSMYILAGREKLEDVMNKELPALQEKAKMSGKPEDAQAANYLADMCNRFDKKLHDLELTRTISVQMGPQIRMVQSTDSIMVEKIQTSLVNTIPLWKNQMVLALGMAHSKSAIQAQRQVTDITNQLLRKNAEMLKTNAVEAARESERGIVDIETLRQTNQALIETLDEVMQIQRDGRNKRREAEKELVRIEDELKNKLLSVRDATR
ncbi:MAG TPA: toxic anion resistance protein [Clostridiales bacterium]|nr:toxic anion resistance protein [Clostridiales bacterium]